MTTRPNPKQHTNTQIHKYTNNKHSKGRLYLTSRSRLRRFIFAFSSHVERPMSHLARPQRFVIEERAHHDKLSPPAPVVGTSWCIAVHRGEVKARTPRHGRTGTMARWRDLPLCRSRLHVMVQVFSIDINTCYFILFLERKKKSEKKRKYYLIWI